MKALREERPNCAAGHDYRALSAERTAAADRNRRRQGFQDCDFRLHAAAAEQNSFERFGNAMAANFFRSVSRHKADNHAADHRNEYDKVAKPVMIRRLKYGRELPEKCQVGNHRDQPNEHGGDYGAQRADDQCHPR